MTTIEAALSASNSTFASFMSKTSRITLPGTDDPDRVGREQETDLNRQSTRGCRRSKREPE